MSREDEFIQWTGDNQWDVDQFLGCDTEEDDCPDDLLINIAGEKKKCVLGSYIVRKNDGSYHIVDDWKKFRKENN